ncbi:Cytochrome C assembly protein [Pseudobythopirellula maris]|uniref:Cytochrome C assembly protein n=1 Tax=Pseudobythopirellula maris TaxID=2527991 RepID=A0A5C5ZPH5_9BACT|nr:hypothetical protein [Pseudobythopirellula maris]TWT89076.1 Cytochrome C assembly protein [Pseudobythopirellula maris]
MDLSHTTVFCIAASYSVALALEAVGLKWRPAWRRFAVLGLTLAGLFAHVMVLSLRARGLQDSPGGLLASPADWCLLAAFGLAVGYLATLLKRPGWATGLFLLPMVLGLVALSQGVSSEAFAPAAMAPPGVERLVAKAHGWMLLAATVTVSVGFLAGLMYLVQNRRLKQKVPASPRFTLPSLEWLETTNGRALGVSTWLVAGGFVTGVALSLNHHHGDEHYSLLTDPVVLSVTAMLAWMLAAEGLRLAYPSARRGKRVAWLTFASFGFLLLTFVAVTIVGPIHGAAPIPSSEATAASEAGASP